MKYKKGVTEMGSNRFMVVLEYEMEDNARDAFMDIVGAYESGKIDVYI